MVCSTFFIVLTYEFHDNIVILLVTLFFVVGKYVTMTKHFFATSNSTNWLLLKVIFKN